MQNVISFIEQNKQRSLDDLIEFLKFKSISSDPVYSQDVFDTAQWLANHLRNIGMENTIIHQTPGHPIVYSQWLNAGPSAPTLLIYGHYDVQPAVPEELWHSPPFEPKIKDGFIIARGTSDDKGQVFAHIKAIEAFFATEGKLPINLKLIIEGEEESGSNNLDEFIIKNREMLACDAVMVSDTEWFADLDGDGYHDQNHPHQTLHGT